MVAAGRPRNLERGAVDRDEVTEAALKVLDPDGQLGKALGVRSPLHSAHLRKRLERPDHLLVLREHLRQVLLQLFRHGEHRSHLRRDAPLGDGGEGDLGSYRRRHAQALVTSIVVLLLTVIRACPLGAECQLQPRNEC